jgi:hypothetical protein
MLLIENKVEDSDSVTSAVVVLSSSAGEEIASTKVNQRS